MSIRSALIVFVLTSAAALAGAPSTRSLTVIAYGDMRFTDPSNDTATNPAARRALVARVAAERPDALLLNGDVPWHGGTVADYDEFRRETGSWRAENLRVLPSLGNHEFSGCEPQACLEHWWAAFPMLRGKRWYSVALTPQVRVIALDTNSSLLAGSEQATWLQRELSTLSPSVQFVLITLHHPPVADIQTRVEISHNPRPNEIALAGMLAPTAHTSHARVVVIAGHIHNYERHLQDDVVYLVSGGGGAKPVYVDRTPDDLHTAIDFPNFHYVKLSIADGRLTGQMYRLDEPAAPAPHFTVKDSFEVDARTAIDR
ncbi:MAG TPA: metallophosphoesterase [Vicinamibacterales bacterium]|nr:metallophosphoesterase [Vicinamibacterales bacterium]